MTQHVACFVTPHGFGHAARCCAVMHALVAKIPSMRFHVFTTVPEWFFGESLADVFEYHHCVTDVGLVQDSPLIENLPRTVERLESAPWRDEHVVEKLARNLEELRCGLVISDISPLGLRLARRMGLPSVLVENFTWDWIYKHLGRAGELTRFAEELASEFVAADLRIQARPVCRQEADAVRVDPVARPPREERVVLRRRLDIPGSDEVVLASMGGVGWDYGRLEGLAKGQGPWVVVPGGAVSEERRGRLVLLPFHSSFYHPDLVHASDVVVGKLGYSTVAEACHGGSAFAYVERPRFPESPILEGFVDQHLTAASIEENEFTAGRWMPVVEALLARERKRPDMENGADQAAEVIIGRFPEVFG